MSSFLSQIVDQINESGHKFLEQPRASLDVYFDQNTRFRNIP